MASGKKTQLRVAPICQWVVVRRWPQRSHRHTTRKQLTYTWLEMAGPMQEPFDGTQHALAPWASSPGDSESMLKVPYRCILLTKETRATHP